MVVILMLWGGRVLNVVVALLVNVILRMVTVMVIMLEGKTGHELMMKVTALELILGAERIRS